MRFLLLLVAILATQQLFGQDLIRIGQFIEDDSRLKEEIQPEIVVSDYSLVTIDLEEIRSNLEFHLDRPSNEKLTVNVEMPLPDGSKAIFNVYDSKVMHPDLQSKFPDIRSYAGYNVQSPSEFIRFETSPRGCRMMIHSLKDGIIMMDNFEKGNPNIGMIYYRKNALNTGEFLCETSHKHTVDEDIVRALPPVELGNNEIRVYRLALACTVEYSNAIGGGASGVLAEMTTAMNRINGIYERDFAVKMELIPNNDLVIYTSNPDPFTNNNGGAMLCENGQNMQSVIGSANYDIGHVFSTGGGGVAYLGVPCLDGNISGCSNSDWKAGGVTGLSNPTGDPFYVDYVAHEMGHQFGANHTQNNNCQRSSQSYEPGSASTIMGYAGICSPNVQNNSDDYFHVASLIEVHNYINGTGNSCPVKTTMTNSAPVISGTGATYNVPISTPFRLTAIATDADGDPMTYCWEQFDNEVSTQPPSSTSTDGPNFRTLTPVTDDTRYFPNLPAIIAGTTPTWEVLPSVTRTTNFKVSVRDNSPASGRVTLEDVVLEWTSSAGPFIVTSPSGSVTWSGNSTQTITWDVANTDIAPVSCANVDIYLSTDGGLTFDQTLASAVPNDGSHDITVPNISTSNGIIMVKCSDNVFLNVGGTITISAVVPVEFVDVKAVSLKNKIDLLWSTTSEINNEGFQIQRSEELNFREVRDLGFVEAKLAGAAFNNYKYTDSDVTENVTYYYRLKQIDLDGQYDYSNVVSGRIASSESNLRIYPNPATTKLILDSKDQLLEGNIEIFNSLGFKVLEKQLNAQNRVVEINVENLSSGAYFLRYTSKGIHKQMEFIKR